MDNLGERMVLGGRRTLRILFGLVFTGSGGFAIWAYFNASLTGGSRSSSACRFAPRCRAASWKT